MTNIASHILSAQLRIIMDLVEDAVFIKSMTGQYLLINRAGAAMLGRLPGDVVGRTDEALFPPAAAAEIVAIDRQIMSSGAPLTYEKKRYVGGAERVFVSTKVPCTDPDTGAAYLIGVTRDVTGRNRLERQLAMDEQHTSVGALAGGVAHEINNPLTYVLHAYDSVMDSLGTHRRALERLRADLAASLGHERAGLVLARAGLDDAPLDAAMEHARQAHQGSERVRDIVRGLQSFARPSDAVVSQVDVHALLDSAIEMAMVELRYRARIEREYGSLPHIRGKERQLGQMFLNLLVGIARSIPEGESDTHRIRIMTTASPREIQVDITDTGPRAPSQSARELAMSIVRYVVAGHRGEVTCAEGPGNHQVVIRIPVAAEPEPRLTRPPSPAPSRLERASILIVDDEPLIRILLRRMLERTHNVHEAESGVDAVRLLESGHEFDAILCDLMMPRMTGMDVYEWIEANRPEQAARIGFVTGGVFTERAEEFMQRCARPVLEKPFDRKGVQALLAQLTAGRT